MPLAFSVLCYSIHVDVTGFDCKHNAVSDRE